MRKKAALILLVVTVLTFAEAPVRCVWPLSAWKRVPSGGSEGRAGPAEGRRLRERRAEGSGRCCEGIPSGRAAKSLSPTLTGKRVTERWWEGVLGHGLFSESGHVCLPAEGSPGLRVGCQPAPPGSVP